MLAPKPTTTIIPSVIPDAIINFLINSLDSNLLLNISCKAQPANSGNIICGIAKAILGVLNLLYIGM